MASERSCSVAMFDRRVMSQYRNFVIMISGASATRPTYALGEDAALMQLCSL